MKTRALVSLSKAHCFRAIACDPSNSRCSNACSYCYDRRFDAMRRGIVGERSVFSATKVDRQLQRSSVLNNKLVHDRVVRIGAMSDIIIGSVESMRNYKELIRTLDRNGIHYMLVTKSAPSILEDPELLPLIKETSGILGVTTAYYDTSEARKFENVTATPPMRRRELVEVAIAMGIHVVLRLNPMHPDFMEEHIKVLEWYSGIPGNNGRVILENLRIMPAWMDNMPEVDFSTYVTYGKGGCYNGYRTPTREVQEAMFRTMLDIGHTMGVGRITICGDMISQDKYGYHNDTMDCCQASEILSLPRPDRVWEDGNG